MILEGIVTTLHRDGLPHLAPMGPSVSPDLKSFTLKPFKTSTTYANLRREPSGVLHITDDVLLLAKAAVGGVTEFPKHQPAETVRGFVLSEACRYFEFKVVEIDDSQDRVRMEAEVQKAVTLRDFFGFNRAKHAVLEAAILATRLHFLNWHDVKSEYEKLRVIVDKTAGPVEQEAMAFLEAYLDRWPHDPR